MSRSVHFVLRGRHRVSPQAGLLLVLAIGLLPGSLRAAWTVTPEPLPRPLTIPGSGQIAIPALPPAGHAVLASTPSPFVLVTALTTKGNVLELWNAETGKSGGPLPVASEVTAARVLSPDGRLMMGDCWLQGGRYTGVYETATAKLVWRSPRTFSQSPWRDFVRRDQVLEMDSRGVQIWDIQKSQLVREIAWDPKQLTVGGRLSPSRRYLVRADRASGLLSHRFQFYDLSDGSLAGELTQPEFPGATQVRLLQTKFSNDGQEFVALFRVSRGASRRSDEVQAIVSWSLSDGRQQACHEMSREASVAFASEDIDCLPDHRGWLLNNAGIVDRDCGKLVWCVPGPPHSRRIASPGWVLDDGRIVVNWGPGQPGEPLFSVVQPPQDLIQRNIAAVRSGRTREVLPVPADAPVAVKLRTTPVDSTQIQERLGQLQRIPAADKKPLPSAKLENRSLLKDLERELKSGDAARVVAAISQANLHKTSEVAELLVRHYDKQPALARASLISLGPVAAPAVAKLLTAQDPASRVAGLQILFHIGTSQELDAVEKLLADSNSLVSLTAAQTQAVIKSRQK